MVTGGGGAGMGMGGRTGSGSGMGLHVDATRNAAHLEAEFDWLARVVDARYRSRSGDPAPTASSPSTISPPHLNGHQSRYSQTIEGARLSREERLVLALALLPHVHPGALDRVLETIDPRFATGGAASLAAGSAAARASAQIPTVETALYLLAGDDLAARFRYLHLFGPDAPLVRSGLITLDEPSGSDALTDARLMVHRATVLAVTRFTSTSIQSIPVRSG